MICLLNSFTEGNSSKTLKKIQLRSNSCQVHGRQIQNGLIKRVNVIGCIEIQTSKSFLFKHIMNFILNEL